MKRLDIDDLYLIRAIAQEASLAAAASRIGVDKSSVSRRIKKIEKIIDNPLINKTGGGFRLTETGEKFFKLSHEVLAKYDQFQAEIGNIQSSAQKIRVIGNPSILGTLLPCIVQAMHTRYPDLVFEILSGTMGEIFEAISSNRADVGIVPDCPNIDGIIFHKFKKDKLCVVIPKDHPLADKNSVDLQMLSSIPLFGATEELAISTLIDNHAKKNNIKLNYIGRTSDFSVQINVAAQSKAVAITYQCIADYLTQSLPVKVINLNEEWAERPFYVCLQHREARKKSVNTFVDLLLSPRNAHQ